MAVDFDKLMSVFREALEEHPPEEWDVFVRKAAGDDEGLYRQACQLLHAHAHGDSLLDKPVIPGPTIDQPITEKPGAQIGPYKLLQEIGEGGMGVVFMAEQKEPVKRRVALKIIKPGMDTRQVIARFEAERQALAMMEHPNIAKVLDAGATESGRPYFVMELVNGIPLTQFCDELRLTPKQRLELFIPVCQAVQHAHQKGIIHRDLKPSNILVAMYDDKPVPKVIDFGVVKATSQALTEKTMFTEFGQIIGTLEYMPPEQAQRNQLDIDTRSDIYSLGVILYELLTGDTPFDRQRLRSATFDAMLKILREEEPPKPSTRLSGSETLPSIAANRHMEPQQLSAVVRGELDWVVMKALDKDRARRYETASTFAEDIRHYLNDEPIDACPPSTIYRFRKFARRNRLTIATIGIVAASLIVGIVGTSWQAVRARRAERDALGFAEHANKQAIRAGNAEAAVRAEKQKLEEALERETALRVSEQEQRRRADENFAMAREAVNEFLTRVSEEELMNLPGLQAIQRQLLSSAFPFYERFVADHSDDPALRFELAEAYRQIGRIHFHLGNTAEGRTTSQEALEMFEQLRIADAANVRVSASIANLYNVVFDRHDEAIEIYREILTHAPDDETVLLALAQALQHESNESASVEVKRRLLDEAESLVRKVLAQNPDSSPGKLTFILNSRGLAESRAGNTKLAVEYYEEAAELGIVALERRPNAIYLSRVTVGAIANAAMLRQRLGHSDQALTYREWEVQVAREVAFANPQVPEVWSKLYAAFRHLARQQEVCGDSDDARRSLWRAADIFDNLSQQTFEDHVFLAEVYLALSADRGDASESIGDRGRFQSQSVASLRKAFSTVEDVSAITVKSGRAFSVAKALQDIALQLSLEPEAAEQDLTVAEMAARASTHLTTGPGNRSRAILALVQHRLGDQDAAADTVAEVLLGKPDHTLGLAVAGLVAISRDDEDSARDYLQQMDASERDQDKYVLTLRSELEGVMALVARGTDGVQCEALIDEQANDVGDDN